MESKIKPTPCPDVNDILHLLLRNVSDILKDNLVGMYLFGSLANGDFDSHSDIDVLFVTGKVISEESFHALFEMHEKISAMESAWSDQLEVSYIPRVALHHFDPSNNRHPHLDRGREGRLFVMQHDADWIVQRYLLYKRGITVTGPEPQTLIAPLSSADLRWAGSNILHTWFRSFLEDPGKLKSRGYQSYTVLTLCRILYTDGNGEIASKPAAAEWAKRNLGSEWTALIDQAVLGRQTPGLEASPEDIRGTLDLIRFTLEHIKPDKAKNPSHDLVIDKRFSIDTQPSHKLS